MTEKMRDIREIVRDEMVMKDKILASLEDGPKTVPEIAEILGCPSHEVMCWISGIRKYGLVSESEEANEDDYFLYSRVEN